MAGTNLLRCWSPGKVDFSVQLLIAGLPVLPMTTWPTNPPAHWLCVVYVTEQEPPVPPPPPDDAIVQVNVVEPDAPVLSLALAVTEYVPAEVGVPEIIRPGHWPY